MRCTSTAKPDVTVYRKEKHCVDNLCVDKTTGSPETIGTRQDWTNTMDACPTPPPGG